MTRLMLIGALALALPSTATADPWPSRGFTVEVLINGNPVPVYHARGGVYIEAIKGKDYAIRLRNPLPVRVAVALSVDGLSTIDARRSSAIDARKWVLDPHETITIRGWQTSMSEARRFYFTSEEQSYAQWLGKTQNIGVITAVFFRERAVEIVPLTQSMAEAPSAALPGSLNQAPPAPAAPREQTKTERAAGAMPVGDADEYAATGIGRRADHLVRQVHLDLEPTPVASVELRYEYRAQLTRLGILPGVPDRLARRQKARGFDGFCPVPPQR